MSWLCGFVEERKLRNNNKGSDATSSEPSFLGSSSMSKSESSSSEKKWENKGSNLSNFFGAKKSEDTTKNESEKFSKPDAKPASKNTSQTPKPQRKRLKKDKGEKSPEISENKKKVANSDKGQESTKSHFDRVWRSLAGWGSLLSEQNGAGCWVNKMAQSAGQKKFPRLTIQ